MSTLTLPTPWIAIRTRARAEKAVRDCLGSQDVEVFLPTAVRARTWSDRIKHIDWPLFPGYCFARFNELQRLTILKTPGVAGIVSFAGRVALVPAQQIDGLRTLADAHLRACGASASDPCDRACSVTTGEPSDRTGSATVGEPFSLKPPARRSAEGAKVGPDVADGALVEVIRGPLTGVVGRLVRHRDHNRLVLSVEMIAQAVSVEVDAGAVKLGRRLILGGIAGIAALALTVEAARRWRGAPPAATALALSGLALGACVNLPLALASSRSRRAHPRHWGRISTS